MDESKLIEYTPEWAAAVADMWNESAEGWNGERFNKTAEKVKQEERNIGALHTFLIVEGEKVLGYCNLQQDSGEKDALYIGMLNVRPEMHGRKLGKRLVLRAVQATCELGFSRLYLHTWTGNTKAVPLYKKTGFFWQEHHRSTHLVNFIPMALRDEVAGPVLAGMDWYGDSVREIEVKPDGVKKDGFEIYTYAWENDGRRIEMDFTRRGRGLVRIETDDWSVALSAPHRRLTFGRAYKASFTVRSKNGQPVEVGFTGCDDGPIRFDWSGGGVVDGEQTFEGEFFIKPIERHVHESRIHPGVKAKVTINGRTTEFKLGISPNFPAWAGLTTIQRLHRNGETVDGWLNFENTNHQPVTLRLDLVDTDDVVFASRTFERRLDPEQKCSEPIRFTLRRPCLYNEKIPAVVRFENTGEEVRFTMPMIMELHSWQGSFFGSTPYSHMMAQGPWTLHVWRQGEVNEAMLSDVRHKSNEMGMFMMAPQLGEPYRAEFEIEESNEVELFREDDAVCMRYVLRSPRWPQAPLTVTLRLYCTGVLERTVELTNNGDAGVELSVHESSWCRSITKVLPMPEGIVHSTRDINDEDNTWDYSKLCEPWAWFEEDSITRAIIWSNEHPMQKVSWDYEFDYAPGTLEPGQSWRSTPVFYAVNVFRDWREAREYAMCGKLDHPPLRHACELAVDTPFIEKNVRAHARLHSNEELQGVWRVKSEGGAVAADEKHFGEPSSAVDFTLDVKRPFAVERLYAQLDDPVWKARRSVALFGISGQTTVGEEEREGCKTWWADNGVIRIAAAPDYAPGLFSLRHDGREWFDNSFPTPSARAWWKPWVGGLGACLMGMNLHRAFAEQRTARHVSVRDEAGVLWRGLRVDVTVNEHKPLKGLAWRQYFLMAPGAPVLMQVTCVDQNTGGVMTSLTLANKAFLNTEDGCRIEVSNQMGERSTVASGYRQHSVYTPEPVRVVHESGPGLTHLPALWSHNHEVCATNGVLGIFVCQKASVANGETKQFAPDWWLFSNMRLSEAELYALHHVKLCWETEE